MDKIIFFGVCVDNEDPALAGRIRVVLDENWEGTTPQQYDSDVLQSLLNPTTGNPDLIKLYDSDVEKLKWSINDPHLCAPFLPPFITIIPQVLENVKIIFYTPDNKTQNKEYIGPTISRPTAYPYEEYAPARLHTSKGRRNKSKKNITDNPTSDNTFPYWDKVALNGRSNADLIFGESEVLLRAGKFIPNTSLPEFPTYNSQMSTIQITNYPSQVNLTDKTIIQEKVESADVRFVVEYEIDDLNPTNGFNGNVSLFQITPQTPYDVPQTNTIGLTTRISTIALMTPRVELTFTNQPLSGVTYLINEFLRQVDCRDGTNLQTPPFQGNGWKKIAPNGDDIIDIALSTPNTEIFNLYPFYFRPSLPFQNLLNLDDPTLTNIEKETRKKNAQVFFNNIYLSNVNGNKGYGLVMSSNQAEPLLKKESVELSSFEYSSEPQGIINAISNKILLYSHDSSIVDKAKINPFLENGNVPKVGDNMGIDQETQIILNDKEMEPLVRGGQLRLLLVKMVEFLKTHVHKEGNTGPVTDGVELVKEMEDLLIKGDYLNENIRIN
jgi:hypothetical protein